MENEEEEEVKITKIDPDYKISIGSTISNPIPDDEYLTKEGNKKLKIIIIYIILDFILTLFMILEFYNFLIIHEKKIIIEYICRTVLCIICFTCLIILFCKRLYKVSYIIRWIYFILGIIYYCAIIFLRILKLMDILDNADKNKTLSIIFFVIFLGTIVPRILVFVISKKYVKNLESLYELKKLAEQEKFVESIASRIEQGYERWSTPNQSNNGEEMVGKGEKRKEKEKYLFKKKDNNNINDDSLVEEDNDLEKIEEIMKKNEEN